MKTNMEMEHPVSSASASSLRWKILRRALLGKSASRSYSPPADDASSPMDTIIISRRTSSHFNMIPWHCESGNLSGDSDIPQEDRNDEARRDFIVIYKLPADTARSLVLTQRAENGVDIRDFEISNQFNIDNTGLVCSWPSEDVLAYFCLKNRDCFRGKRVIELGSGYGLAGLTIAAGTDARDIVISDGNPTVVDYLRHNINANAGTFGDTKVDALTLHWDQALDPCMLHSFDAVVASDCTFFEEYHAALARTVKSLLRDSEGSTALLLSPRRGDSLGRFLLKVNEMGLRSEVVENYDPDVWRRHLGFLSGEDRSWPNYDQDHCYPLLIRLSLSLSL